MGFADRSGIVPAKARAAQRRNRGEGRAAGHPTFTGLGLRGTESDGGRWEGPGSFRLGAWLTSLAPAAGSTGHHEGGRGSPGGGGENGNRASSPDGGKKAEERGELLASRSDHTSGAVPDEGGEGFFFVSGGRAKARSRFAVRAGGGRGRRRDPGIIGTGRSRIPRPTEPSRRAAMRPPDSEEPF